MNRSTVVFCVLAFLLGSTFGHGSDRVSKGRVASVCTKNACVIEPEVTEGPYYYDTEYVREDITEGMPGIQLNLTVTVLDIATCSPITKAAIDIWHCDASGVYSWFVNDQNPAPANSTFLRGIVLTDSYGAATFKTIYPGWYVGRATHIHVKVHINGSDDNGLYTGGSVSLTSQFFFDDSINDQIYENELYSGEPTSVSRVLNSQDSIYNEMNGMGMLDISMMDPSQGYAGGVYGKITIVVDTTASSTGGSTGAPSGVPPPPPSANGGHGTAANGAPSGQPARPSRNPPSGQPPRPSGAPSGVPPPPPPPNGTVPSGQPPRPSGNPPSGQPPRPSGGAPSGVPPPPPPPNGTVPSGQPPRPSGNPPSGHPPRPSGAPSGVPPPPPSGAPSNDSVIVGETKSSPSQKPPQPSGAPSRVPPPSGQPAQPSGNPPIPSGAPSGVPPPPPNGTVPSGQPPRPSGNPPSGQPPRPSGGAPSGVPPPPPPSGAPESSPASDSDSESENLIQLSNPEVASSASMLRHMVELLPTLLMLALFL